MGTKTQIKGMAAVALLAASMLGAPAAQAWDQQSWSGNPGGISAHTIAWASDRSDIFGQLDPEGIIGLDSLSLYASSSSAQTQRVTVTNTVFSQYLTWFYQE